MTIWMHDWSGVDSPIDVLKGDFEITDAELENIDIVLASYGEQYGYDGDAFVLFRKNGKLYEVNGSHCSCYGLEGEWKPEETSVQALRFRIEQGELGRDGASPFANELIAVLAEVENAV